MTISTSTTVFVTGDDLPAVDVQLNPNNPTRIATIDVGGAHLTISDIGGDDEASVLRDVLTWIRAELTVAIDQLDGPTTGATADRPNGDVLAALIRAGKHHDLDLVDADLTGTNLIGADLRGADLTNADLRGADLADALRGPYDPPIPGWRTVNGRLVRDTTEATVDRPDSADLAALIRAGKHHDLDLSSANLSDADLSGANLTGANLTGANLSSANLRYADLSGATLAGATLSGAIMHGANLGYTDLYGAHLYGADLTGANLRFADLRFANLSGANLTGADLSGAWRDPGDLPIPGWHVTNGRLARDTGEVVS